MSSFRWRVLTALLLALLTVHPPVYAESDIASEVSPPFDPEAFTWAYGQTIDTITVTGNLKTESIALLRELELRAGDQLNRIALERDHRYLTDVSSVATVVVNVYPVRDGYCSLDFAVTERPTIFLKLIYPIVEYNFNTNRFRYGLRVNNRNFRKRLETLSAGFTRNSVGDDNIGFGWSTRWMGWRHMGVGAWVSYFNRGQDQLNLTILERTRLTTEVSIPLTDSRISFAQAIARLAFTKNIMGYMGADSKDEILISPALGFSLDRRNSPLRPTRGGLFWIDIEANRVVNGNGSSYYRLRNDIRLFRSVHPKIVLACHSSLAYQFGKYPDYIRFGLGGAGTVRGYANGLFEGRHRWIQTLETRLTPFPTWIFSVPYAKTIDVTVAMALFVDTGIVWDSDTDFHQNKWLGGFGFGLRVFSPFQDVARIDLGFTQHGDVQFYFGTGLLF